MIKLLEFGLVLPLPAAIEGEHALTRRGTIAGTPDYMSPEQAVGQTVDGRSDIHSIGALAWYLLTGAPPFARPSIVGILAAHLYETAGPLRETHPDVPADLEAVVLRCLAKDPDDRFRDARSLEQALAACRASSGWSANDATGWWLEDARECR